jgi:ATP-binding cassette subfamily F protein uup
LEDFLESYQGCIIIVSHDRYFMDKLVDHMFVFEGEGVVNDFPGNYSEWRRAKDKNKKLNPGTSMTADATSAKAEPLAAQPTKPKQKLSFKEKFEFEALEKDIPALEKEKSELNYKINHGNEPYEVLNKMITRLGDVTLLLETKEVRWLELSEFAQG